jgi:hypothetical protein
MEIDERVQGWDGDACGHRSAGSHTSGEMTCDRNFRVLTTKRGFMELPDIDGQMRRIPLPLDARESGFATPREHQGRWLNLSGREGR